MNKIQNETLNFTRQDQKRTERAVERTTTNSLEGGSARLNKHRGKVARARRARLAEPRCASLRLALSHRCTLHQLH